MNVKSKTEIKRKRAKWETELWSYINEGDGTHCPLNGCCQAKQRGGACIDDNKPLLEHLGIIRRSFPENYISVMADDSGYKEFLERWIPGRIFQLVERLAYEYLKKGMITEPPVPTEIVSLADENSTVEVHLLPLKMSRGAIWRMDNEWMIQLREKDTPVTRKFTLFHEVFHIMAHCQANPTFIGQGKEDAYFNEVLADYFAFCVLVPKAWVIEQWRQVNNINRMAEIFNVLEPHIWIRLKQLRLI